MLMLEVVNSFFVIVYNDYHRKKALNDFYELKQEDIRDKFSGCFVFCLILSYDFAR